jgi:diacylglycerol kinase family enzyme
MNEREKIFFIINPVSGRNRRRNMPELIKANIDPARLDASIAITESRGHATQLAEDALKQGIKKVVAIGGDGLMRLQEP